MRCAAIALLAATTQGYSPDPHGVPADFLCGWRKLALAYATSLRPDSAAVVHDALQMSHFCNGTDAAAAARPDERALPRGPFPPRKPPSAAGAIIVDGAKGSDSNAGTAASPLKTIGAGVAKARAAAGAAGSAAKTVELRGGTYYMTGGALALTEADSGLTLQNYGGEEVISPSARRARTAGAQPAH